MARREKEIAKRLYREYLGEKEPEEFHTLEYRIFKERKTRTQTLYEYFAKFAGKIFKFEVPPEKKAEIEDVFQTFGMNITAEDAQAMPILFSIFAILISTIIFLISSFFGIAAFALSFYGIFYFWNYPSRLIQIRRSHAMSEIVLSVLYIVIYMRNISNLEAAVRFAAENLEGPLARDFKKILWDVETKTYPDVQTALNAYLEKWKKYNEAFVDSIYLIETSLIQRSEERRISLLDQALKRILDGTYEMMVHYVNNLRTPVSAVFMLGITLPVMGLVMLPLIGAFMAQLVNPKTLFVFYDVLLPLVVVIMINQILATRPSAFPQINVEEHPLAPPKNHFYFLGKPVHAAIPAFLVFILFSLPFLWYILTRPLTHPNEVDVFFSLFFVLAIAFAIITFAKLATGIRVKIRKEIKSVEEDFSYAVFQFGNRLAEGAPAEIAMLKTAQVMKTSRVKDFVETIANNMTKLGLDLRRAIFDKTYGAIKLYPSSLIRSVMRILIQSIKKSQKVASVSMMNVSSYLLNVHKIEEKIKDVLSETLSTLKFQSSFIAPLISGIIVGLTSMIMIILDVLSEKLGALSTTSAATFGGGLGGSMAFGFFEMSNTIPLTFFQIIVGIYLIEITIISAILASKIEVGDDRINELHTVSNMLAISIIIYFVVALFVTIAFSGMAKMAVTLGEFA